MNRPLVAGGPLGVARVDRLAQATVEEHGAARSGLSSRPPPSRCVCWRGPRSSKRSQSPPSASSQARSSPCLSRWRWESPTWRLDEGCSLSGVVGTGRDVSRVGGEQLDEHVHRRLAPVRRSQRERERVAGVGQLEVDERAALRLEGDDPLDASAGGRVATEAEGGASLGALHGSATLRGRGRGSRPRARACHPGRGCRRSWRYS